MSHCVTLYHLSQELGNATARHLTRLHFPLEWTERADHRRVTQLLWQCHSVTFNMMWQCHSVTFNISPFVLPHPGVKFCTGEPRWKVKNGQTLICHKHKLLICQKSFATPHTVNLFTGWPAPGWAFNGDHAFPIKALGENSYGDQWFLPPGASLSEWKPGDNRLTNQLTSVDIVDVIIYSLPALA